MHKKICTLLKKIKDRQSTKQSNSGFTLIEILLVVAAIAILAGIVIVAINPARLLQETRNSQRWSDINQIYKALSQYDIENNGNIGPLGVTTSVQDICTPGITTGCLDLDSVLAPIYIANIPVDPLASGNVTGYQVFITTSNRFVVQSDRENYTEAGATIVVGGNYVAAGG